MLSDQALSNSTANDFSRPTEYGHSQPERSTSALPIQAKPQTPSAAPTLAVDTKQLQLASRLLNSNDRQRQIQALEYLRRVRPTEDLKTSVKRVAEQSNDAIVKGYARLLAADWGVEIENSTTQFSFSDPSSQPHVAPGQASSIQAGSIQPNSNRSVSIQANFNEGLGSNRYRISDQVTTNIPVAAPIGVAFSDSGEIDARNPTQILASQSAATGSLFLTPQTPFWASSASHADSIPADVDENKVEIIESFELEGIENGLESFKFTDLEDVPMVQPVPNSIQPEVLNRPIDAALDPEIDFGGSNVAQAGYLSYDRESPLGFTGRSGVIPTEYQSSDHFVPIEDRWRLGFPEWDRYGKDFPRGFDYPFKPGSLWDPYNQNVLKGDFPVIGQHTFFSFTGESLAIHEFRQTPTATTPFESTQAPFSAGFFGEPNQYFYAPYFKFTFELFHGNEAFKPLDWKFRIMPVLNLNNLDVEELAVVNPDVRLGTNRYRQDAALEEWYLEAKLADIGPDYDFVSARVGSQFFVSDFRGFIFRDVNRAVRLFGTRLSNRDQFNLVWFDQAEKDTNSELNTFRDRHQNVVIANYFRQDFVFPGYTAQASFHYNHDKPSFTFDDNNNLVRPDPVGVFKEHEVNAYYLGLGGEGHIGRINLVNQFYVALGEDSANPIGGTEQRINARMAALELSYDRDWIRFRTSYFYASGDDDPNDSKAEGFDTIVDDPIFAGGEFSYWQRQSIKLFGTNLVQRKSIVPNLRSSKQQGQSNFVNPGLHLFNIGADFEITPKSRVIANANYLYFDKTEVLKTYTFQDKINREIGTDLSLGLEYRPFLNDNAIIVLGIATLLPDEGLEDLFGSKVPQKLVDIGVGNELRDEYPRLTSAFVELVLTY